MKTTQYYRKITALFPRTQFLTLFVFMLSLSFLALVAFFALELNLYFHARSERSDGLRKLSQIEKQIQVNPNYPNLYIAATVAAERVGSRDKALLYATKASLLDPLNNEAQKLKQELEN